MRHPVVLGIAIVILIGGGAARAGDDRAQALPKNTAPPTISGTARAGQTLTGSRGSWTGTQPITFSYQWFRCSAKVSDCESIPGATNETYTLTTNDIGHTVIFFVRATNADGRASAESGATGVVAKPGQSPANVVPPAITGTPTQGETLAVSTGRWAGTQPITFAYHWERCNASGGNCADIASARTRTYVLAAIDVGHTIRARVTASNSVGRTNATSVPTPVVGRRGSKPENTSPPTIDGTPRQGETLAANQGNWTGTQPISFAYQWLRCNQAGGSCADIGGATARTYVPSTADVSTTLRVRVSASNSLGRTAATSAPTAQIAKAEAPAGGAVAIGDVSLPNRLIIDRVSFRPNPLRSRHRSVIARFRVSDSRAHVVQGALVFVLGVPYGWMSVPAEQATGADGYATFVLHPGAKLRLRAGALVFFVRARKPGENLLAGVSTRRLVQLSLRG